MKLSYLLFSVALVVAAIYYEYQAPPEKVASQANVSTQTGRTEPTVNKSLQARPIKDYKTARYLLWERVYKDGGQTLYCREPFSERRGRGINVEHVFPMSWVTNALNCGTRSACRRNSATFNRIEADLHNLHPSRTDVNKDRSSYRFGLVKGEARRYGALCDFEVNQRSRVAEPAAEIRGDIARAMFYMADKYSGQGLVLYAKQAKLLYRWHQNDPPDAEEARRNRVIEKIQGNRNVFVDVPAKLDAFVENGNSTR